MVAEGTKSWNFDPTGLGPYQPKGLGAYPKVQGSYQPMITLHARDNGWEALSRWKGRMQ